MFYLIVLVALAIIALAAFLHFRYPDRVGEKPAALGALGAILLLLVPVLINSINAPPAPDVKPERKGFPQSKRPFEQEGAFKPEEVWPPTYGYPEPEPPARQRTEVEPANKDVVTDPEKVPIGGEAFNPPPTNAMRIFLEPLGDNVAPGTIIARGHVEDGNPPLRIVDGFLSGAYGNQTYVLWEGTLEGETGFWIFLRTQPSTKYALKIKATDTLGEVTESGPFHFSTGPQ